MSSLNRFFSWLLFVCALRSVNAACVSGTRLIDQDGDGRGHSKDVNDVHTGYDMDLVALLQTRVVAHNSDLAVPSLVSEGARVKIKQYLPHGGAVGHVVLGGRNNSFLVEGCEDTVYRSSDLEILGDEIDKLNSRHATGLVDPSLFVALFSPRNDVSGRNTMRPWLAKLQSATLVSVTVRFAICDRDVRDAVLKIEQQEFGDLLLLDCHESDSSVTHKVSVAMRAYVKHYGNHSFFMKLDDGTFVAWHRLMQIIVKKGTMWSYIGGLTRDSPVNPDPSARHYGPVSMRGHAYLLGGELVRSILDLHLGDDSNEDHAVSELVMAANQNGTVVDILPLPYSLGSSASVPVEQEASWDRGWPSWLDRAPSRSGSWAEFPYVMVHHLSKENISCLMDVSVSGKANVHVDACFSIKANLSVPTTLLVSGYPRSGTSTLYAALAAAVGYGFSPLELLSKSGLDDIQQDAIQSFTGLPKLFSLFEPCHWRDEIRGGGAYSQCPGLLSKLAKCDFRDVKWFVHWDSPHNFLGARVPDNFDKNSWPGSFNKTLLQNLCDNSSIRLFKTVAFTYDLATEVLPLLAADPEMHVVDIVRDPRGIVASWKVIPDFWLMYEGVGFSEICQQFRANIGVVHPRIHRVVFDDFVSDPLNTLSTTLDALGLAKTATMEEWVSRKFNAVCNVSSASKPEFRTCRTNSTQVMLKWMDVLNETEKAAFASDPACQTVSAYYNFTSPGETNY